MWIDIDVYTVWLAVKMGIAENDGISSCIRRTNTLINTEQTVIGMLIGLGAVGDGVDRAFKDMSGMQWRRSF